VGINYNGGIIGVGQQPALCGYVRTAGDGVACEAFERDGEDHWVAIVSWRQIVHICDIGGIIWVIGEVDLSGRVSTMALYSVGCIDPGMGLFAGVGEEVCHGAEAISSIAGAH